jgi:DNA-binding NarL/FixJ family response regulator
VTRVLIAEDDEDVRTSIKMLLVDEDDIEIVGEAVDGEEAIRYAEELQPDIVLMDIRMPRVDGVSATTRITSDQFPRNTGRTIQVVVLTMYNIHEDVYRAIRAGATGFLLKDRMPGDLARALRAVASGDGWLAPEVIAGLLKRFKGEQVQKETDAEVLAHLTPREREILVLIANGLANAAICARLHIADTTVKTHVSRIFAKLGVRDRSQAVVAAYETGLVQPKAPGRPAVRQADHHYVDH